MKKAEKKQVFKKNSVIPNLIWNLQRLPLLLLNNMRGRSRIKYGMTSLYNSGFTLIELLVVVLIIGILAARALPQYQVAVRKTRTVEVLTLLRAIAKAEEVYYLANGTYTDDVSKLDVEFPKGVINATAGDTRKNGKAWYSIYNMEYTQGAADYAHTAPRLIYYFIHTDNEQAGTVTCYTKLSEPISQKICLALGGVEYKTEGDYIYYTVPL